MNLVEQIENQLSDAVVHKLGSLIGAGESTTRSALGAAVPALLSGLSGLASSTGGAQQLISALGKLGGESAGQAAHMLSEQPNNVLEQGSGLLHSLFGNSALSGIVNAVSRFAGTQPGSVQKLLGFLTPMVLGAIAGRFTGKAPTAQGLTSMLADQKANIARAMPSGFSLSDVPGMAVAGSAARSAAAGVQSAAAGAQEAGSSLAKWLLPVVLGLAALALVLYLVYRPKPADVTQVGTDLTSHVKSLGDSLHGIKDVSTADAAVPKIKDLNKKLDDLKAQVEKLPAAEREKFVKEQLRPALDKLKDQANECARIPGVGDKVKDTLNESLSKMASIGGLTAPKIDISSVAASGFEALNKSLGTDLTSLTDSLGGITDAASAAKALPNIAKLTDSLDGLQAKVDKLEPAEKAKVSDMIKPTLAKLEDQFAKLLWIPGLGDKFKPAMDRALSKVASLANVPMPKLPGVSGELAGTFTSLTETLKDVKDEASVDKALPKLKDISNNLAATAANWNDLPAGGKNILVALIKPALEKLKEAYTKMVAQVAGGGGKLKEVMDPIMKKLDSLVAG
jgi:hypothetical protein